MQAERSGIPHLAKNQRDAPNFLHAALDKIACTPFFKERRMKFVEPTKAPQEIGVLGHPQIGYTSCLKHFVGLRPAFFGPRTLGRTWGTRPEN